MKKIIKAGLLTALLTTLAFASSATDLAQKIAKKVQPRQIDSVTYLAGAKAENNKVIATLIVNNSNNYLTYTFKHKDALNMLKQELKNRLITQSCRDKHLLKALNQGVKYEIDYVKATDNKVFLTIDINKNTCKGGKI